MSGYDAYELENDMQATSAAGSSSILFSCTPHGAGSAIQVTGTIDNDLDLSERARFRIVFRASRKMIDAINCENKIVLPDPAKMKPFPAG
ncbi:hypothetical protein AB0933_13550 [Streptomyces venezuelae]|uniref:hypothetical protein n=1 Tax=Streptomyces venezuelae TaxID=54571 RepID=UPI003455EC88